MEAQVHEQAGFAGAASFPVSWSGTDPGGSGIANYDICVSTNSGAYTLWLPATTLTSGTYLGAVGQTYSFYSMATDNIGLRQQTTGAVQTITVSQVSAKTTPTVTVSPAFSSITTTQALSVTVVVNGGTGNATPTGSVTLTSGSYESFIIGDNANPSRRRFKLDQYQTISRQSTNWPNQQGRAHKGRAANRLKT